MRQEANIGTRLYDIMLTHVTTVEEQAFVTVGDFCKVHMLLQMQDVLKSHRTFPLTACKIILLCCVY